MARFSSNDLGEADITTRAVDTVNHAHHEIHDGRMFRACTVDVDADTNDEVTIAFTTPNTTRWIHLVPTMESSVSALWEMLETPTVTVDSGTESTAKNRNRNSPHTSGILSIETVPVAGEFTVNPTVAAAGTVICSWLLGANKTQGTNREETEWVLKQNTTYAFRVTSQVENNRISLTLNWYEHINRD